MPRGKRTTEEIAEKLQWVEALRAEGRPLAQALRSAGITEKTYNRWRSGPETQAATDLSPPAANPGSTTVDAGQGDTRPTTPTEKAEPNSPVPAETEASPEPALGTKPSVASVAQSSEGGRREAHWRPLVLAALLVAGPTIALTTALVALKDAKTEIEDAFRRTDATVARLETNGTTTAANIEMLQSATAAWRADFDRMGAKVSDLSQAQAPIARELDRQSATLLSQVEKLRQEMAADRDKVARLTAQLTQTAQAQAKAPVAADLDRARTEVLAEVGKLEQKEQADHSELERLRTEVKEASQTTAPLVAQVERQKTELLAALDKLPKDGQAKGSELERLRTEVREVSHAAAPLATQVDRQKTEFLAALDKLRGEAAIDRTALAKLGARVTESLQSASPAVQAALDRQKAELAGQVDAMRREMADTRSGLDQLKLRLAKMPPAAQGPDGQAPDLETASIQPPHDSIQGIDDTSAPPPSPAPTGFTQLPQTLRLPQDAIPRVVLRFARDRDSARKRAAALQKTLTDQGLYVVKSAAVPARSAADKVVYFYAEDLPNAERVAAGVKVAAPVQGQFSVDDSLPRPGTIEVTIVR